MTSTIWVTFLVGQVGGHIPKLDYLDLTWILNSSAFMCLLEKTLASDKRMVNALNRNWCETSLLPQAVLKHVITRDFILKKSVHETSSVPCQEQRIHMALFYI